MNFEKFKKNHYFGSLFWVFMTFATVFYLLSCLFGLHSFSLPFLFPNTLQNSEVVIVTIDDDSIKKYGNWPWDRNFQIEIFNKILESNPKKLGLDIMYPDLSNQNATNSKLIELLKNPLVVSAQQIKSTSSSEPFSGFEKTTTGFIEFEIDQQSFVRKSVTKIAAKQSFSRAISNINAVPDSFLINPKTARPTVVSVRDLMENNDLSQILQNKYVLFGTSALALNDFHNLPGIGQIPGVSIHSLALQQILEGEFWQEYLLLWPIFGSISLILACFWQFIYNKFGFDKLKKYLIFFNLGLIILFLGFLLKYLFLDLNAIISIILANTLLPLWIWVWSLSGERENIKNALTLYISQKVMQKIMLDPSKIDLGGQKYNATIMFTDIRGFTSFSEEAENVHEVAKLLNQVLALQTDVVLENEGVVDKYIGDAVMAFWGAPITTPNHAYQSILSACQIQAKITTFNLHSSHKMEVGIGLNTGICLIGNFGSSKRLDYTAIGDTVNTASRIEGITKFYGAKIIASKSTIELLTPEQKAEFWIEELDSIKLKGKQKSIKIYEIIGQKKNLPVLEPNFAANLAAYRQCRQEYYKGDFDKAIILADKLDFKRAQVLSKRSQELKNEPNLDWDGVWSFDHK